MDPKRFVGNGNDGLRVYLHEAYLNIKLHTAAKTGTRAQFPAKRSWNSETFRAQSKR